MIGTERAASTPEPRTRWGTRAAELYTEEYAERYRACDASLAAGETVTRLGAWLRGVCDRFPGAVDALDLGCGTGRYFHALRHVRRLVGIDASRPMLDRARHPVGRVAIDPAVLTLVEGDFLQHDFQAGEFDVVYAIGVLAEHAPFDAALVARVYRWLKPGGRFAFTTVHPLSFSVPRTLRRRAAERLLAFSPAPAAVRRALRARLMSQGIYADEERVRDVLEASGLAVESIERFTSDVHLHVLAVARK